MEPTGYAIGEWLELHPAIAPHLLADDRWRDAPNSESMWDAYLISSLRTLDDAATAELVPSSQVVVESLSAKFPWSIPGIAWDKVPAAITTNDGSTALLERIAGYLPSDPDLPLFLQSDWITFHVKWPRRGLADLLRIVEGMPHRQILAPAGGNWAIERAAFDQWLFGFAPPDYRPPLGRRR